MNALKYITILFIITGFIYLNGCSKDSTGKTQNRSTDNSSVKSNNLKLELPTDRAKGKIEYLTDVSFKEKVFNYETNKEWKYEGEQPCIIDFYADWCAPCKRIAPILENISDEYDGKIQIYKVNIDAQQQLAAAFGVQSIPSILFVPKSGQPQMVTGAIPRESFDKAISEILLK